MIAPSPIDILRFARCELADGRACALVTLVGVEGSASRGVGAQMAVAADGRSIGSFSGGCIEAAVAAEAVRAIETGATAIVRFGVGSPYLDIRLPCGGGIDLHFMPLANAGAVEAVLKSLAAREPASLTLPMPGNAPPFAVSYDPPLRIIAIGQGDDLRAFARIACRFGSETVALSPDIAALGALEGEGVATMLLTDRTSLPEIAADRWTAIVFLFHDRDWEEFLLLQALRLPACYHGAVGSPNTHRARVEHLRAAGIAAGDIAKLRGCIGLIPSTRDPATLALSILAEVVATCNPVAR